MKRTVKGATATPILRLAAESPIREATIVPIAIYQDCVDDLRQMLGDAEAGEIIGYAVTVMYKGREYIVRAKGEVDKSPTFARGMVAALDDYFKEKVHA